MVPQRNKSCRYSNLFSEINRTGRALGWDDGTSRQRTNTKDHQGSQVFNTKTLSSWLTYYLAAVGSEGEAQVFRQLRTDLVHGAGGSLEKGTVS